MNTIRHNLTRKLKISIVLTLRYKLQTWKPSGEPLSIRPHQGGCKPAMSTQILLPEKHKVKYIYTCTVYASWHQYSNWLEFSWIKLMAELKGEKTDLGSFTAVKWGQWNQWTVDFYWPSDKPDISDWGYWLLFHYKVKILISVKF